MVSNACLSSTHLDPGAHPRTTGLPLLAVLPGSQKQYMAWETGYFRSQRQARHALINIKSGFASNVTITTCI